MKGKKFEVHLEGEVTAFSGNGRKLGYPTANFHTGSTMEDGVYFAYAKLGIYEHHPALVFIGIPTTVGDKVRRVEAHLLDIEDIDYYGDRLALHIEHFYRPHQNFATVDELIEVMHQDEAAARTWFKKNPPPKKHQAKPGPN